MQTKALKLRENFYWAGILDDTLRVFDIIMYTEFGTTYNSYIYKAGDKVILFETVKAKFFDDYLKELKEITDVTKIDYLVVNHTEPDHEMCIRDSCINNRKRRCIKRIAFVHRRCGS